MFLLLTEIVITNLKKKKKRERKNNLPAYNNIIVSGLMARMKPA
jgi:hypothetical protein